MLCAVKCRGNSGMSSESKMLQPKIHYFFNFQNLGNFIPLFPKWSPSDFTNSSFFLSACKTRTLPFKPVSSFFVFILKAGHRVRSLCLELEERLLLFFEIFASSSLLILRFSSEPEVPIYLGCRGRGRKRNLHFLHYLFSFIRHK